MAKKIVDNKPKLTIKKRQPVKDDVSEEDSGSDMEADVESSDNESDDMDLDTDTKDTKRKDTSEAFSEAMTNILGSALTGSDRKQPILARSKGTERKLEDEKLEYKTRKMLAAEKKKLKSQGRVIPDFTSFEYEKRLRKVSTRGVVKLFNAIRTQQKVTEVAVEQATASKGTQIAKEKAKNVSTMSKSNFLDLLKTGNTAA
ncbi:Rrp15p-domain-containing protein [Chlamydoabsidia padenii]|nr:Rrp15p-domain-containing protein [Chlamydoabsidia padenii]